MRSLLLICLLCLAWASFGLSQESDWQRDRSDMEVVEEGTKNSKEREILIFTDIHIDYVYNLAEDTLKSNSVLKGRFRYPDWNKDPEKQSIYIGDYGWNPTAKLAEMLIHQMIREAKKRDVSAVLFLGDMSPHLTTLHKDTDVSNTDKLEWYRNLKRFLHDVTAKYLRNFKNKSGQRVPVYMNFGNHDVLVNYQTPDSQSFIENGFYEFIDDLYLKSESSLSMGNFDKDRSLFESIGCYIVKDILDISKDSKEYLSLMSLNSLYFSAKGETSSPREAEFVFRWIEDILSNSPHKEKFIITFHIPAGVIVQHSVTTEWKNEYNERLKGIFQKYSDKIVMTLSGHLHYFKSNLPLYFSDNTKEQVLSFNFGSMSPVLKNNPLYYFVKFGFEKDQVTLNDILVEEFDLHELMTRERSYLHDIIGSLTKVPEAGTPITKEVWVGLLSKVMNAFLGEWDTAPCDPQWLFKYILFTVGFELDAGKAAFFPPVLNRWNFTTDDMYQDMTYNTALYCSYVTLVGEDYEKCIGKKS